MTYEISINIIDENYIDNLIVALARQGHDVYYNKDQKVVCFTTYETEVLKIDDN